MSTPCKLSKTGVAGFPVPDSRYSSVKVILSVFGEGSATSGAPTNLLVDSALTEPVYTDSVFVAKDENAAITFTATPTVDTKILSWSGCDTVTSNLSQCIVSQDRSRSVTVNFGRTSTSLKGVLHDLSRTTNIVTPDEITVQIPDDMADMISEMDVALVGDFVVGDDNGGFLRKITAINKVSAVYYVLDTVDAAIDEVVSEGTGQLYKQMTNGELEGYTPPAQVSQRASVAPSAFTGLPGVELLVADQREETRFTITLGKTEEESFEGLMADKKTISEEVTLYEDNEGNTLTAKGEITIEITLDTAYDYSLLSGLKNFKYIVITDAEEKLELTANNELAKFDLEKIKIGTLRFSPIVFSIGPVPVWVTPVVEIFLFAEGKIEAEATVGVSFKQRIQGGLLYNKDSGFSVYKNFSSDRSPILPTAKLNASLKGGIETSPVLRIYDATGPAVPLEIYLKLKGSASTEIVRNCSDIVVEFLAGASASFKWDLNGSSKLGKMLHLDQLEAKTKTTIFKREWNIEEWTLYDNCSEYVDGSHLVVEGGGIFSTINMGDANGLATTLVIKNTGDQTLNWNSYGVPVEATLLPTFGSLDPGEQEVVQMSLSTAGLPAGRYKEKVFFFNEASGGSSFPDEKYGNTHKEIDVNVLGTITDIPVLHTPTSSSVGTVNLSWDFTPTGNDPFVGFQIFATTTPADPTTFTLVAIPDIYTRSITITGFRPGRTYTFDMRAYTNNYALPGQFSNKVSVIVAGYNPASDYKVSNVASPVGSNHTQVCVNEFGIGWREADWNELEAFYAGGGNLEDLVAISGLNVRKDAWVTRDGTQTWYAPRDYFVSYHNHNPPVWYQVHAHIDNHFISLGTWYDPYYVLCKKD